MDITQVIRDIQNFAPLPALLLLAVFWKTSYKDNIYIGLYLLASLVVNVLAGKFQVQFILGYFVQSYFGLFTIVLFAKMFRDFTGSKQPLLIGALGVIVYLSSLIFIDQHGLPKTSATVSFAWTLIFCLYYFFQLYKKEEELFIEKDLRFITVSALFMYSAGATFTFLMLDQIANTTWSYLYAIHNILSIISMAIFATSRRWLVTSLCAASRSSCS